MQYLGLCKDNLSGCFKMHLARASSEVVDLQQADILPLHKFKDMSAVDMLLLCTCVLAKCPKPASMSLISRQDILPRTYNGLQASQMDLCCNARKPHSHILNVTQFAT